MKDYSEILSAIKAFQVQLTHDKQGRFMSWEHCYNAFALARRKWREGVAVPDYESLSLHLAFYLASWGMYRGSSFLLQKDYLVHVCAVKFILEEQYDKLQGIELADVKKDLADGESFICGLYGRLAKYYAGIRSSCPKKEQMKSDSVSDTLITKIMLGTLGCVPAYDRYFRDGIGKVGVQIPKKFSKESLLRILEFVEPWRDKFELFRESKEMRRPDGANSKLYPPMKLIDMAFWQYGAIVTVLPKTELPAELVAFRTMQVEDARQLNGNTCCLMPFTCDGCIIAKFDGVVYKFTRDSFGLDEDAFESTAFMICDELKKIGCEILDWE